MLYTHQAEALEALHDGKDIVVVTPTASGKTLCYGLPVLQAVAEDPAARALYLFPTKALSQDQLAAFRELATSGRDGCRSRRLRRRHAGTDQHEHPDGRPGRGHQPGHAPQRDPAPSHQVVPAVRAAALHRGRRDPHLPRHLRQPRRQRPATPPAAVRALRQQAADRVLLGDHRQSAGARRDADRPADEGDRSQRRARGREARGHPEPAAHRRAAGHPARPLGLAHQTRALRSCAPAARRSSSARRASPWSCC